MTLPQWIMATQRTVIVRPPPVPDHFTVDAAFPPPAVLPFSMQCQRAGQWCWAAVAVSVASFYSASNPWTQSTLAAAVLGRATCGNSSKCLDSHRPSGCDRPHTIWDVLRRVGHLDKCFANPIELVGVPNTVTIQGEVDGGRPTVCRIQWDAAYGHGGHFVVLHGYDLSGPEALVHVADPESGSTSAYPVAEFMCEYKLHGTWQQTYTTTGQGGDDADPND
jgi:hypothetical protein